MSVERTTDRAESFLDCWAAFELEYVMDDPDSGPVHCTMFPCGANGAELLTSWISADEGSFVSLADSR